MDHEFVALDVQCAIENVLFEPNLVEWRAIGRCLLEDRVHPSHFLLFRVALECLLEDHVVCFRFLSRLLLWVRRLLLRLSGGLGGLSALLGLLLLVLGSFLWLIILEASQVADLGVVLLDHEDVQRFEISVYDIT